MTKHELYKYELWARDAVKQMENEGLNSTEYMDAFDYWIPNLIAEVKRLHKLLYEIRDGSFICEDEKCRRSQRVTIPGPIETESLISRKD